MCPNCEGFYNFKHFDGGEVYTGDDNACNIIRIGDIKFKMFDGMIRTLKNVIYFMVEKKFNIYKVIGSIKIILQDRGMNFEDLKRVIKIIKSCYKR